MKFECRFDDLGQIEILSFALFTMIGERLARETAKSF